MILNHMSRSAAGWWIGLALAIVVALFLAIPVSAQKGSPGSGFKDLLSAQVGKTTNIGKILKVSSDYFTVEEDNTTAHYRIDAIQGLLLIKDEETKQVTVEIKLLAD